MKGSFLHSWFKPAGSSMKYMYIQLNIQLHSIKHAGNTIIDAEKFKQLINLIFSVRSIGRSTGWIPE